MKAEFFYRKPLKEGELKPAFGKKEPDPDRPDHKGFFKEVFNSAFTEFVKNDILIIVKIKFVFFMLINLYFMDHRLL